MSRAGEELAELLWDAASGPALRTPLPPFQPFTCSAAGSTRAHELHHVKRHDAAMDVGGLGGVPIHTDDDAVPWLHCPVIDDDEGGGDSDTAPLPPEYLQELSAAVHDPTPTPLPPPLTETAQPLPGEGVMNFSFFSRPLQRRTSHPLESTAVAQTAASRLRSTPLFSDQRMAWLHPPPPNSKGPPPRAVTTATAPPPPASHPPPPDHHRHRHFVEAAAAAATVTERQHRLLQPYPPPDPRRAPPPPDAAAAVTTSSVCSGNGDRSQTQPRSSSQYHHQPTAECSVSPDEDMDHEPSGSGAARARSSAAARGTKRTRIAEVHNLSERRRRDRINEKMRALQELIPNCNKIDKASMLEEAIEYLKTLQLQVQMMSMGTGLCMPQMLLQMPAAMAPFPHLGMGLAGYGMAPAFDMLPRFAAAAGAAQFPCPAMMPGAHPPPPMAMPHHMAMFGVPAPAAFAHAYMNGAAPPEQREVPATPGGGAAVGDQPPVAVTTTQGEQRLQHPKQTST